MLMLYVKLQTALQFLKDDRGQDIIEYTLLGALIATASVTSMQALATAIGNEFKIIALDI